MIPEKDPVVLEADPVPRVTEQVNVMGPMEEARVFEGYLDDDGDENFHGEHFYVEEIAEDEEDPLDLMMLVYHAVFQ